MKSAKYIIILYSIFSFGIDLLAQPKQAEYLLNTSRTYEQSFELDSALKYVNLALSIDAYCTDCLLHRARLFRSTKRLDRSITDYSSLIYIIPDHPDALWERAHLYYELKLYDNARNDMYRYMNIPKGLTTKITMEIDNRDGMVKGLSTLQSEHRDKVYLFLGRIAMENQQPIKALELFDSGLIYKSKNYDIMIEKVGAFISINENLKASNLLLDIVNENPDLEQKSVMNLFRYASISGNHDLITKWEDLNQEEEITSEFMAQQALYLMEDDLYEKSLSLWDKLVYLDEKVPEYWLNKGISHYKLNEFEQAKSALEKCVKLSPMKYEKAYLYLGIIRYKEKKWKEAIVHFNIAILIIPNYTEAFYNRSLAHYYLGNYSKACEDLKTSEKLGLKIEDRYRMLVCGEN
jgi:tetratricopeptide (TPR) repeat protein